MLLPPDFSAQSDKRKEFRLLRGLKNRYGSTDEACALRAQLRPRSTSISSRLEPARPAQPAPGPSSALTSHIAFAGAVDRTTNHQVGLFEMKDKGLLPVREMSEMFVRCADGYTRNTSASRAPLACTADPRLSETHRRAEDRRLPSAAPRCRCCLNCRNRLVSDEGCSTAVTVSVHGTRLLLQEVRARSPRRRTWAARKPHRASHTPHCKSSPPPP